MGFHDKKKKMVNSVWKDYFRVLIREKRFFVVAIIYMYVHMLVIYVFS